MRSISLSFTNLSLSMFVEIPSLELRNAIIAPKTIFTEKNIALSIFDYRPNVVKGFAVFICEYSKCFPIIKTGLSPCAKP